MGSAESWWINYIIWKPEKRLTKKAFKDISPFKKATISASMLVGLGFRV